MKGLLRPGKAGTGSALPVVDLRVTYGVGENTPEAGEVTVPLLDYDVLRKRGIPLFRRVGGSGSTLEVVIFKTNGEEEIKSWDDYALELGLSAQEKARATVDALAHTEPVEPWGEEYLRLAWARSVWFKATALHFFSEDGKACLRLAGERAKLHVRDGWSDAVIVDATTFSYTIEEDGDVAVYGHNLAQVWLERVSDLGTLEDGSVGTLGPVETEDRDDWWVARSDGEPSYPIAWRAGKRGLVELSHWSGGMYDGSLEDVIPGGEATGGAEVGFYGRLVDVCDRVVGNRYGVVYENGGYSEGRDVGFDALSLRARFKELVPNAQDSKLKTWLPDVGEMKYFERPGVYRDSEGKLVMIRSGGWLAPELELARDRAGTPGGEWDNPGTGHEVKAGNVEQVGYEALATAGVAQDGATRTLGVSARYLEWADIVGGKLPVKVVVRLHIGARTRVDGEWKEFYLPMYANLKGNVGRAGEAEDVQRLETRTVDGKVVSVVPAWAMLKVEEDSGVEWYQAHQTLEREFEIDLGYWAHPNVWLNTNVDVADTVWEGYRFGDWE